MAKRRVIRGGNRTWKERAWQFLASFTSPSRFKRYWLNADGARRFGIIAGAGFLTVVAMFAWFAKDLPNPGQINARIGSQNTVFYDRTGTVKLLEVHGDKNRTVIDFNQMPQNLKNATVAIEDRNFYHEGAFSSIGLLRALFVDLFQRGSGLQGGSTITQQYVKNALLDPNERTITRKIKELILSLEIDQLYKKDDILKLYLNEIPYGSQAYGIEAACRTYYHSLWQSDKDICASHLNLSQSALLAAMPNAPTFYSPYGEHIDSLVERQHLILDRMAEQRMISQADANKAKVANIGQTAIEPAPHIETAKSPYPHFAHYAEEFLASKLGSNAVDNGGLKVITSLDVKKQELAQKAVDGPNGIRAVRRSGGSNVAMVSADPKTGQVLAMIGSYNPDDQQFGQFNVALANRQPGSSFKPFVYATAMKGNWGAGSTVYDVQTNFGGDYQPKNYSGRFYGVQSMRTALDGSLNIPAVKMLHIAGVGNSVKTAHDLGISTLNDPNPAQHYGLSLVLGSGEVKLNDMVNAYESFANGGLHYESTPIVKVTDPHNRVLMDTSKPKNSKRVLDPQISYIMANILSDNQARSYIFGANNPLHIPGRTVAAKTGTTENYNDAWTMGFSPDLVTGVWAGNNDNKPMSTEAVDIAAPIWNDYMKEALKDFPTTSNWTQPSGIQKLTIDANTGGAVTKSTRARRTDIFPSWYKIQNANGIQSATIDKVSGKLATDCTPPAAKQFVSSGQIQAEIPATDPDYKYWEPPVAALARGLGYSSGGSIPRTSDDVHHCDDAKPTVSVTATGSGPLHITANVTSGTFPANQLTIYFDDQSISTQTINGNANYSFDYTPTSTGSHTVKAVVTDTGMYSGEDQTTVNVTSTGPGGTGQNNPFPGNNPGQQQPPPGG